MVAVSAARAEGLKNSNTAKIDDAKRSPLSMAILFISYVIRGWGDAGA
jgi:hypothetical protein